MVLITLISSPHTQAKGNLRRNEHERTRHGRLHRLQLPARGGTQGHEFLERALLPRGGREHLRGTRALLRVFTKGVTSTAPVGRSS